MTSHEQPPHDTRRATLGLGLAGIGAATLTGALFFSSRSAGAIVPGEGFEPVDPPTRTAPLIPGEAVAAPIAPVRSEPYPRELVTPEPQAPSIAPDPCSDIALAQETFSRALSLLACSNPEIRKLSRDFVEHVVPRPTSTIPNEQQQAFLEATQTILDTALTEVRREMGDLTRRNPDAFIEVKGLPADYSGVRFEVHPDQFGERRPMLVTYQGPSGRGYRIPTSDAGRRLALQKILLDGGATDGAWYELLTPKER